MKITGRRERPQRRVTPGEVVTMDYRFTKLIEVTEQPVDDPEDCPSVATFENRGETFTQVCVFDRGHDGPHLNTTMPLDPSRLAWTDPPAPASNRSASLFNFSEIHVARITVTAPHVARLPDGSIIALPVGSTIEPVEPDPTRVTVTPCGKPTGGGRCGRPIGHEARCFEVPRG